MWRSYHIALAAGLIYGLGAVMPATGQTVPGMVSPCGGFTTTRHFGETDFEFHHKNFQHCAQSTSQGLTVVDAIASLVGQEGHGGDAYVVTCQCTQAVCVNGDCK